VRDGIAVELDRAQSPIERVTPILRLPQQLPAVPVSHLEVVGGQEHALIPMDGLACHASESSRAETGTAPCGVATPFASGAPTRAAASLDPEGPESQDLEQPIATAG